MSTAPSMLWKGWSTSVPRDVRVMGVLGNRSYGVIGSKNAEYCAKHALVGMVNVYSKSCARDGCFIEPELRRTREQERSVLYSAHFGGDGRRLFQEVCGRWMF